MLRAHSAHPAVVDDAGDVELGLVEAFLEWFREEGLWWLFSCVVHMCAALALALVSVKVASRVVSGGEPKIVVGRPDLPKDDLPPLEPIEPPPPDDPASAPILTLDPNAPFEVDNEPSGSGTPNALPDAPIGGFGGERVPASGVLDGNSILDMLGRGSASSLVRKGDGNPNGHLGQNGDFGPDHYGRRHVNPQSSKKYDKAILAALNWIARHQLPDGRWSLQEFTQRCGADACTGRGSHKADTAATGMAVLPFLAAGQTHLSKMMYAKNVEQGLRWLVQNQKADGDLRGEGSMYAHALATIALCEAYGMTQDRRLETPARKAVEFIVKAQNPTTGGWRYVPGEAGDTSVVGWQVMALKSAQIARIAVDEAVFARSQKFLRSVATGRQGSLAGGQFAYQPGQAPTPSMTSVGLLCLQYMGTARNDAAMIDGTATIMQHLPAAASRDIYFWYYASQVMYNQPGPEGDTWDRAARRALTESQQRTGCQAGSWDPKGAAPDRWGDAGGRLMVTCLSALTLEVRYRWLPLYKTNADELLAIEPK